MSLFIEYEYNYPDIYNKHKLKFGAGIDLAVLFIAIWKIADSGSDKERKREKKKTYKDRIVSYQ
jgi:hypothetical protein